MWFRNVTHFLHSKLQFSLKSDSFCKSGSWRVTQAERHWTSEESYFVTHRRTIATSHTSTRCANCRQLPATASLFVNREQSIRAASCAEWKSRLTGCGGQQQHQIPRTLRVRKPRHAPKGNVDKLVLLRKT